MTLFKTGLVALVAALAAGGAHAQADYPAKPIRWLIPFTPGGGTDFVSRTVGTRLAETTKWTVLLENYSENYHTPFVHPEIDTSSSHDYPMLADGLTLYAWDRPLRPTTDAGVRMATLLPGEPGWEELGSAPTAVPYDVGSYLTLWPNLMLNVFPDASLAMWMEPLSANRTVVHRRLYAHPGADADAVAAQVSAHRLVHLQDIDICASVQRTHDAGVNADGVLATVEERGVFFVHQHIRRAMGDVAQ